jgi:GNAT superfamily N-acetyltransferase
MVIRQAEIADIEHMSVVRLAVKENVLSNPALVTYDDYVDYLTRRGRGWVAEVADRIAGFAVVDLQEHNVWALFVHPSFEGQGLGRALHETMLDWYFSQTKEPLWLGTEPGTRAEAFYRKAGWCDLGLRENGEVKFEMASMKEQK